MTDEWRRRGLPFYYPVASVLLLLFVVGFGISTLWGVIKIVLPSVTVADYDYRAASTFDTFLQNGRYMHRDGRFVEMSSGDTLTKDQVEAKRQEAIKRQLGQERRNGLQQVLLGLIAIGITLPLYLYHHRVVQRAKRLVEEGH